MVFSNDDAEKIVINAGPTFGEAIKFVVLGALIGAGAVYLLNGKSAPTTAPLPAQTDAVQAGLSGGGAKTDASSIAARVNSLAKRAKKLAGRTQKVVQFASDAVAPAVSSAMQEGRRAAREMEDELTQHLETAKAQAETRNESDEPVEKV